MKTTFIHTLHDATSQTLDRALTEAQVAFERLDPYSPDSADAIAALPFTVSSVPCVVFQRPDGSVLATFQDENMDPASLVGFLSLQIPIAIEVPRVHWLVGRPVHLRAVSAQKNAAQALTVSIDGKPEAPATRGVYNDKAKATVQHPVTMAKGEADFEVTFDTPGLHTVKVGAFVAHIRVDEAPPEPVSADEPVAEPISGPVK